MCPAPQKHLGGASQPQRCSGPELWISSARRRRVRAARGRAARPRGLTWARPHLPGPRGVSGACVGRGYAGQEETRRGRAAPHSRDSSRSRACARVGEPGGEERVPEFARPCACPASVLCAPGGARPAQDGLAVSAGYPGPGPATLGDRDPRRIESGCSCPRVPGARTGPEARHRLGPGRDASRLRDAAVSSHFLPPAQNGAERPSSTP